MIRFSVVLPVRNGAAYVAEAVRSVLGQTVDNLELIVLDGMSSDDTLQVVAQAAGGDPRVRVFPAQTPLSITENWHRIRQLGEAGEVRGEFMTTLGHDDRLLPDFLEVISGLIDANPDLHLFLTHFRQIDAQGRVLRNCRPIPARESAGEFFLARCHAARDAYGTGYAFRTRDYLASGGIPLYPRLLFSDDMLWLRLMKDGGAVASEKICFEYRVHAASASAQHYAADKYVSFLAAFRQFVHEFEDDFPDLMAQDVCRAGLKHRIGAALSYVEKGAYRAGFGFDAIEADWQALAQRFDRLALELKDPTGAPMRFRYRPFKRLVHALRRLATAQR